MANQTSRARKPPQNFDDMTRQGDRADYEQIADALATLCEKLTRRVHGIDLDTGVTPEVPLERALLDHMQALLIHANFFDRSTLTKFYVELRLHGDELARKHGTGHESQIGRAVDEQMRREWEDEKRQRSL